MIFSIGDVQSLAVQNHSLRPEECCAIESAVAGSVFAGADCFEQSAVEPGNDNPVVIGIGNEQAIILCVSENLTGKGERQVADFGFFQDQLQRSFIQFTALAKVGNVHDRMFDLVAENDAADVLSVFFVFKFGGVNADNYQFIRILFLELLQIRNDVHTVDAAVSPKIQQHDFAF